MAATPWNRTQLETYQFQISPNTPPFILNVSNYQLNGICTAAYCIYGDRNVDHMFKFGRVENGSVIEDYVGPLMADEDFVLANDQSHSEELPAMESGQPGDQLTWLQYIQTIEDALDVTYIKDYTCILKDIGWVLVKFDNFQFLEGVIGLCTWLGKDWRKLIQQLHRGESLITNLNVNF